MYNKTFRLCSAKKRKNSYKEESSNSTSTKKDKRLGKKERSKSLKKTEVEMLADAAADATTAGTSTATIATPVIVGSITDVFAEELLEKAKKSFDVSADAAAAIKKGKTFKKISATTTQIQMELEKESDFDIPTISEISSTTEVAITTGSGDSRAKDLAELAAIQKKIYAAKKHLKEIGQLPDAVEFAANNNNEEEDEFLNLNNDGSADGFNDDDDRMVNSTNNKG